MKTKTKIETGENMKIYIESKSIYEARFFNINNEIINVNIENEGGFYVIKNDDTIAELEKIKIGGEVFIAPKDGEFGDWK
jgi:hypothetical protein